MKGCIKFWKQGSIYRRISWISENYGINNWRSQKKDTKMPLKKGDIVLFYIPRDYADTVGLLNSDFYLPGQSEESKAVVMIARFLEYDEFGGVWMSADVSKTEIEGAEIMIPHDMIMSMFINPTEETEKQLGFNIPQEYKKRLNK